jgi:hypothetical protein
MPANRGDKGTSKARRNGQEGWAQSEMIWRMQKMRAAPSSPSYAGMDPLPDLTRARGDACDARNHIRISGMLYARGEPSYRCALPLCS